MQRGVLSSRSNVRRFCTVIHRHIKDEGDWSFSSEWWGSESNGNTILSSTSDQGNGIVSVLAYPSSRPIRACWSETERWLDQRYAEMQPTDKKNGRFKILGYQWRSLRFNDDTRQSTVKIMAAYRESEPESLCFMQQANCLAVPYLKSMVSAGLSAIESCNYDLMSAVHGKKTLRILCIGHGGGSLPLFLASKIPGATVDAVEIDPLVISTSVQAMGFPAFSVMTPSGERASSKPDMIDEVLWKGIHERIYLYEADAEKFVLENNNLYDLVFIDAYDGDDIFAHKLWDPRAPFLQTLSKRMHPDHGTVVVNLHSDSDIVNENGSDSYFPRQVPPAGRYLSKVSRAYMDAVVGNRNDGLGFIVSAPWVCNSSLVVCRGIGLKGRDLVMNTLMSNSIKVEQILDMPFSCLEYIKRDFMLLD